MHQHPKQSISNFAAAYELEPGQKSGILVEISTLKVHTTSTLNNQIEEH